MRLLLDELISSRIAAELRERGHEHVLAHGDRHHGVIYTFDDALPRNKAAISLWVTTLERLLRAHEPDDALLDRTLVLQE